MEAMLEAIGVVSVADLFVDIPEQVRLGRELALPAAASELEVERELAELAERNVHTGRELSFLGAGVYDHYVPAVVDAVTSRSEKSPVRGSSSRPKRSRAAPPPERARRRRIARSRASSSRGLNGFGR